MAASRLSAPSRQTYSLFYILKISKCRSIDGAGFLSQLEGLRQSHVEHSDIRCTFRTVEISNEVCRQQSHFRNQSGIIPKCLEANHDHATAVTARRFTILRTRKRNVTHVRDLSAIARITLWPLSPRMQTHRTFLVRGEDLSERGETRW